MDRIIRTGFEKISHSIDFNPQKIINGKKLAEVNVVRVEEIRKLGIPSMIRCSVIRQTNISDPPYKVSLELDDDRNVITRSCNCVSQASEKCKHIYALIHYINTDRSESKTSSEQGWGKPSDTQLGKDIYSKPLAITDEFPLKKSYGPLYKVTYSDLRNINCSFRLIYKLHYEQVERTKARLFINELCDEVTEIFRKKRDEKLIKNLLTLSKKYYYSCNIVINEVELYNYFVNNVMMTDAQIIDLCLSTSKQSTCTEWHLARQVRISASQKAHSIKNKKTQKDLIDLAGNFVHGKSTTTKSMMYGNKNEKKAIDDYVTTYNTDVISAGVLIKPRQSWLCASVDGLVVVDGKITKVLEVKCPSSCASKPIFDIEKNIFNVKYLYLENNQGYLKKTHIYYTQCQILMYVTGVTICDFFIWSPKGSYLINIKRDDSFLQKTIPALKKFYFTYYLKALLNKQNINKV